MNRTSGATKGQRLATAVSWAVLVVGLTLVGVLQQFNPSAAQAGLTVALALFFATVLVQLGIAIAASRRRLPLSVLFAAIGLWATGSAMLNGTTAPDLTRFPSPGEGFFLLSYVGIAAYLALETGTRTRASAPVWLDTTVICGGAACLAGTVVLSPVAHDFGGSGLPLFFSLLYPLIDLVLLLLVLAQVALRLRAFDSRALALAGAFGLWAVADSQFIRNLSRGTYDYNLFNDICWGLGFALLAWAACATRRNDLRTFVPRRMGSSVMAGAGSVAILVLMLRPGSAIGPYLMWPAVITLVAAGGRLAFALRDANRATEAFALSHSDDLTMLPNRRAILVRLDDTILAGKPLSLMILDLDGFKDINDTLGHVAGDAVLQTIGHRMRAALPTEVMIARLGGDEFAAVVADDDPLRLMETGRAILEVVRQPIIVDGVAVATAASLGITTRTSTDTRSGELLRRADVAMYQAKRSRAGALLYDPDSDDFSRQKLQLSEQLRSGIEAGQIELWYQPQIDARSQQVCGFEALVRWRHPEHGILSPAIFLPAARRAGLMMRLSEEVGRLVVTDLHQWRQHGQQHRVAMNCAPPELMSGAFLPRLFQLLQDTGVDATQLTIEVTEDSFLAEPERARTVLLDIRDHGLQISIDDYGTGFSSLSYLRDLPVNELKIDRSFIASMTSDRRSRMIVASTIQMAQALGLRTVAEGIEDQETANALTHLGVDVLQGYHLARPMPGTEVNAWWETWQAAHTRPLRLAAQPTPATALRKLSESLHGNTLHPCAECPTG